jgi:uncharacterized protein YciI
MRTFLYRIWPDRPELLSEGPTPDEERVIGEHYEYLRDLSDRGVVLLAGRTRSNTEEDFGIVILAVEDAGTARSVMADDPAVREGVFVGDIFPYDVAILCADIAERTGHR